MFKFKTISILFIILTFSSCSIRQSNKELRTKTESRDLQGFTGIHVSSGIDVILNQGAYEVIVETDENQMSSIQTNIEKGSLVISRKAEDGIDNFLDQLYGGNWNVKVYVTLPNLTHLKGSSGADILGKSNITSNNLNIKLSSGSDLRVILTGDSLDLRMSSGSDVDLEGKVKFMNLKASSGSDVGGYDFVVDDCIVKLSSGSDVKITVQNSLDLKASGGSDIKIKGDPKIIREKLSGASDFRRAK